MKNQWRFEVKEIADCFLTTTLDQEAAERLTVALSDDETEIAYWEHKAA